MKYGEKVSTLTASLPPCCIQKHPTDDIVLIGTYKLEKDETKHGSVVIYESNGGLRPIHTVTTGAVLDLKFNKAGDMVATCHHDGSVVFWRYEDRSIRQLHSIAVFEDTATSVNFCPHNQNLLTATCTDGSAVIIDIETSGVMFFDQGHDLECWINAFGEVGDLANIVFTGGDDSKLIAHDMRTSARVWSNNRSHQAGVVSILPATASWNSANPNHLWTGSYDDHLRIMDLRVMDKQNPSLIEGYIPVVKQEENLGGGVWRLIPSPNDNRVLVCCMYDGARIAEAVDDKFSITTYFKGDHESMCYGGDWLSSNEVVTCSFYDHIVHTWNN